MGQTTPLDDHELVKEEVIVTRAAIDRAVAETTAEGNSVSVPRNLWDAIVMARYLQP